MSMIHLAPRSISLRLVNLNFKKYFGWKSIQSYLTNASVKNRLSFFLVFMKKIQTNAGNGTEHSEQSKKLNLQKLNVIKTVNCLLQGIKK